MDLALTVVGPDGRRHDLQVEIDPGAPVSDLVSAVATQIGLPGAPVATDRDGTPLDPSSTVAAGRPVEGDEIHLAAGSGPGVPGQDLLAGHVGPVLAVVGGPRAGTRLALVPGREYRVGRDPGNDLCLQDERASRVHLHIGVGSRSVVVTDLGSSNGTFVEGRRLTAAAELAPGAVVEVGSTALVLQHQEAASTNPGQQMEWDEGQLVFNRPPRVARPAPRRRFRIPTPPGPLPRRRIPLAVAFAPVLMGAVMAFVIGPQMLLFSLMGPVMLGASTLEDRRTGRRDHAERLRTFHTEMAQVERDLAAEHAEVVRLRREAAPDPAVVAARVRALDPVLWERRLADDDLLAVRLGLADRPTALEVEPPRPMPGSTAPGPVEAAALERALALAAAYRSDPGVPVDADLRGLGVLGLAGADGPRDALLRWIVVQAAAAASPRDLAIVVLAPAAEAEAWSWTRWLPHTRTLVAGLPGARTAGAEPEDVRAVFQVVDDLVATRRLRAERSGSPARWGPQVLVVVPGQVAVPGPALSRVLSEAGRYGVSAVIGAPRPEHLPGECRAVVQVGHGLNDSTVTVAGTGEVVGDVLVDGVDRDLAEELARRLAALRDRSASGSAGEVPRRALLLDLLEMAEPSAEAIGRRWASSAGSPGLAAPIGVGSAGVVEIDLRRDGPHGLVAGTTGAGKSELLQSTIGALAATHPASRLTFVLIDYKGGAAFKDCVALPHTVGFFTDLDAHLARRALVSLNAELRRREEVLRAAGAKDLMELERRSPEDAPANLLLVVDEFAFLKKEVPEFVAGIIDIAQRGRSLGVHLLLATQRPSGVVDDNIRANTNLRIALRIADEADSNDVVDRPDAAHIPKSLPGRCIVRVGAGEVSLVQSAYANARSAAQASARQPTRVRAFPFASGLREPSGGHGAPAVGGGAVVGLGGGIAGEEVPTDLQRLVVAVAEAHRAGGVPDQPPPWLDPLPSVLSLGSLAGTGGAPAGGPAPGGGDDLLPPPGASELAVPVGRADRPGEQAQRPWWVDLGTTGHLLVYGASGAGKTQALRSIAAALASRFGPEDLHLYGLDMASGALAPVAQLPQCGAVVTASEAERIDRLFGLLDGIVTERKAVLASAGASSLAEHRQAGGRLPYVVVLVDSYGPFHQTYLGVDRGELVERFGRIVADGRSAGVHVVVTADRRNAVPAALSGAISSRLVLRMADGDEYSSLGLSMALAGSALPAGRGFHDGVEVQVAVPGQDPSGPAQVEALATLAASVRSGDLPFAPGTGPGAGTGGIVATDRSGPAPVHRLAEEVRVEELIDTWGRPGPGQVVVGLSGLDHRPVALDLVETPVLAVFGPDRSGRTTALHTVAEGLRAGRPDLELHLLAPRRSALGGLGIWTEEATGVEATEELARRLEQRLAERLEAPRPWAVVIDDGEELAESPAAGSLSALVRRGRDAGLIVVAAVQTHTAHRAFGGWITDLRKSKHGLLLDPAVDIDGDLFGIRLPQKASRRFPPGRAYVVRRGHVDYLQVARTAGLEP